MSNIQKTAVVAVGGNSLIKDKEHQSSHDQYLAAVETMTHVAKLIKSGYNVVLTHGNGPQVGFALLRSEIAKDLADPVPLDYCVADTQGSIGYSFQKALENEFRRTGINMPVATVVTQVIVDPKDPSFLKPTKPIGQFYSEEEAEEKTKKLGWNMAEDAGRGWRRVVASPKPLEIVEQKVINLLANNGVCVIAVGGGGIPVAKNSSGDLEGTAAVIDKDYASALLAANMKADVFIVSTAVEKVYLNYGKANQKALDKVTVAELETYCNEGHFKPGSMLPKCQAVISFLKGGGKHAIITSPENLTKAIEGKTGTHIIRA